MKEKNVFAQYKAKNNVQASKYDEEIQQGLQKLEEETLKLVVKSRETQQKSRLDEEMTTKTDELPIKSPTKAFAQYSKLLKEPAKSFPVLIMPPSFSAKEIRSNIEPPCKTGKFLIEPSPKNNTNNIGLIYKGLLKDPSKAKSLSYDNLKLKNNEKPKTNKIKQNVYHELLRQKYGFIQPRLNR